MNTKKAVFIVSLWICLLVNYQSQGFFLVDAGINSKQCRNINLQVMNVQKKTNCISQRSHQCQDHRSNVYPSSMQSVECGECSSRSGPSTPRKYQPRLLKTIHPWRQTRLEAEYISSATIQMSRYIAYYSTVALLLNKLDSSPIPQKIKASMIAAQSIPRILSSIYEDTDPFFGRHRKHKIVQENVQTTHMDPTTGKVVVDKDVAIEAFNERTAYLVLQDLRNIREGIYPFPSDLRSVKDAVKTVPEVFQQFAKALRFGFSQNYSGRVDYDTMQNNPHKPSKYLQDISAGLNLPEYYLNDFHSVPGGFLAKEHPPMYDLMSETVFFGTAHMSRRMMLRPLAMAIKRSRAKDGEGLKLLDLGTANGSFLPQLLEAFPALTVEGLDLSPAMLRYAEQSFVDNDVIRRSRAPKPFLFQANMENIPRQDSAFDFVTQSNCFHEMPEYAIRNTVREIARVLKPGGLAVLSDAVQFCDDACIAATSRVLFDSKFNEPFMLDYMTQIDLDAIFAEHGLLPVGPPQPYRQSTVRTYLKG